jgi:tetratricopeptide (TPR) repeat protein
MNDTCRVLKHRQLLNDEKCVKLLDTALKQEPGYTIAYWLKAVISENSNSSKVKNDAIGNYYMMLRGMEHKEYACEQLYFYARYLKKMQKRNDEAFKYYEKAQYFNPVEYKSLCHMGKLQMEKKEHRLADIILDEAKKIIFLGFKNINKNPFLKASPFSGGTIFSVLSFTLLASRKLLIPK